MVEKIREFVFGKAKDPLDPQVFHNIGLIAFFAWVGLGADGLSSSCYGPEEAFLTLGHYTHLAIFLALAMAATVFILSASYSQIIELFPTGGGGYLVASKLISPQAGLVSGCALLVDYILTVAISIASSQDAIFSFLPSHWQPYKLTAMFLCLGVLILLNLRGIKESVIVLTPIFIVFLIAHTIVIVYGIFYHGSNLPVVVADTVTETRAGLSSLGFLALGMIFLRAFCLGGGTFTGIEAVSNGLQVLREPRVKTGKRTMLYMAVSLAFTAGGILVCYLLNGVRHTAGQTLNATLVHQLADPWPAGRVFFLVTLLSEGALLLVAAQAGFMDGPRVMSNMAVDHWLPGRFKNLSDRLVIKDGILVVGLAASAMLLYTRGSVRLLVVMYSINVFLTFSLSQYGMVIHWLKNKKGQWGRKLMVNVAGLAATATILVVTASLKFREGGWVTLAITGVFIYLCLLVKRHYMATFRSLRHLDEILTNIPLPSLSSPPVKEPNTSTAILMVNGFNGLGMHSYLAIHRFFPGQFKNFVFLSVGVIDSDRFKGTDEIENLRSTIQKDLDRYVDVAQKTGCYAESKMLLETDVIEGLETLCRQTAGEWSKRMFFTGQLAFEKEHFWTRFLHNQTSFALQRKLLFDGMEMMILPIRVRQA